MSRPVPGVHVYPQLMWHCTASIIGTREGIEAVRDAINEALAKNDRASAEVMASDGEGYDLIIEVIDEALFDTLYPPYVDEVAR